MRIDSSTNQIQQAELASRARETAAATPSAGTPAQPAAPVARVDRVEISDAGRALAAQQGGEAEAGGAMSAERVAELRQRVLSGAYNSLDVVDQVARRMLDTGAI
jgi:anti-sigma28 factor (negative regulator of flagellin synthesis)